LKGSKGKQQHQQQHLDGEAHQERPVQQAQADAPEVTAVRPQRVTFMVGQTSLYLRNVP
jgi:hypothetical protein